MSSGRIDSPGRVDSDLVIDSLSYSAQTLTTVGYGNWERNDVKNESKYVMRLLSFFHMLFGASYFAWVIGYLVNLTFEAHR